MKSRLLSRLLVRTVLLAWLLLAVASHAIEIRLAPGRVAHGFAFAAPNDPGT